MSELIRTEVTENLYVKLTEDERLDRARTAANLQGTLAEQEFTLKAQAELLKRDIKDTKAKIAAAVEAHNSGREHQLLPCVQVFDPKARQTWFEYRGDQYQRRAMNEDEIKNCAKDIFGKATVQLPKHQRNADEIAKQNAAGGQSDGEPEKLPPELGNAKATKKKPTPLKVAPADDPREDQGYTDPKKNGGKS